MSMRVLTFVFLAGAAATASAADDGFYFGATGGRASYDFEPLPVPAVVTAPFPIIPGSVWSGTPTLRLPFPGPVSGVVAIAYVAPRAFWLPGRDDEATSWSVLAGYRFLRYFAVELAYQDLGTLHEYQAPLTIPGVLIGPEVKSEMESRGGTLSILGQLPITDMWSVYLRAGGLFVDQDVSRRFGSIKFEDSYDSEVFQYGIGTQLDFGAHWSVRLDFQRFDDVGKGNGIGEADVDTLTLGVLFRLAGD